MSSAASGGTLLAAALAAESVSNVFGLPGVQLDPAMDGMYSFRDQLRFLAVRHEQSASYLADGYARTSGRPGVAMVVPGPGVLNAAAGLATAYACSSPVLLVTGSVETHMLGRGLGALHEISGQSEILSSLTKWSAVARYADEIPDLVHEAFFQMQSGRPGPVALEIAPDVLRAVSDARAGRPYAPRPVMPDPDSIADTIDLLRSAKRPLIIAGGGVAPSNAGTVILELAELLNAPVVLSRNGRGGVDARHPQVLDPLAMRRLRGDADVVLAFGTRLGSSDGGHSDIGPGRLVMVNVDRGTLRFPRPQQLPVYADAGLAARAMVAGLRAVGFTAEKSGWGDRPDAARRWVAEQHLTVGPQMAFLDAIRSALPDDGIFVSEYTQVGYVASISFPAYRQRGFISPGYQGTLGYGFATALGAQVGAGEAPVVSVTGDGGFSWTMSELSTAKKYHIPLTVIVFTDGFYSNVRRMQRDQWDGHYIATELTNPDYVALANAFGVNAARAADPAELAVALKAAIASGAPRLIEVPVGEFPSPWGLIDAL
ncbi:MAG: acetolactate synthase large subunit [Pseudonocardiales bacterium]|nr:acetolactate synthase large subunit [Pseudonocardiales bacterium]